MEAVVSPKDVQALIKSAASHDYDFKILNAVERVNEKQKMHIVNVLKIILMVVLLANILHFGD